MHPLSEYDSTIKEIASYTSKDHDFSNIALKSVKLALLDAMGCALLANQFKACSKLLGPIVKGTIVPKGSRVIGTKYILDPVNAAFQNGLLIRWLDYNDTFLAKEWGHPSDNLGALLSLSDFISRKSSKRIAAPTVLDLLKAMVKAYEIQGVLALETSYNRVGFDHIALVKVASSALSAYLLGLDESQIAATVSQAFIDVGSLRTYRHAPNTGSRKSWAAGDATSKGVFLAYLVSKGEMGYPKALSSSKFGLSDVLFNGKPITLGRPLGSYIAENILFKVSFPAEFHAQTAVECAIKLHPKIKNRFQDIEKIEIETQESANRIINKPGPFHNPADRDHSLQYMVAVGLAKGSLLADDYEDEAEKNEPLFLELIKKMKVYENKKFSEEYLDPELRSIANSIKITFKNDNNPIEEHLDFPLGHKSRREESVPFILNKFKKNTASFYSKNKTGIILDLFEEEEELFRMPVSQFMEYFIP